MKKSSAKPAKEKGRQPKSIQKTAEVLRKQSRKDRSDVLGSYTGTPADGGMPEQDADDL